MRYKDQEFLIFKLYLLFLGIRPMPAINPIYRIIGLNISELISLVLLLLFVLNFKKNMLILGKDVKVFFLIMLFYVLISTSVSYVNYKTEASFAPINVEYRVFVQIIRLFSEVVIGLYFYRFVLTDYDGVVSAVKNGLILVFLGVAIQVILQADVSWNIGTGIKRINGFSGEPKMFAAYLAPFLFLMIHQKKKNIINFLVVAVAYVFSFSTSSFIVMVLSFLLMSILRGRLSYRFIATLLVLGVLVKTGFLEQVLIGKIGKVIGEGETYSGFEYPVFIPLIGKDIYFDGNEASLVMLIINNPWVILSGVGFGMETVYAYLYFNEYTAGFLRTDYTGVISPNNAFLGNLLNYGLVLLGYVIFKLIKEYRMFDVVVKKTEKKYNMMYFMLPLFFSDIFVFSSSFNLCMVMVLPFLMRRVREEYSNELVVVL